MCGFRALRVILSISGYTFNENKLLFQRPGEIRKTIVAAVVRVPRSCR